MAIPIFCTFFSYAIGFWVKLLPPTLQNLYICVSSSVLFLFLNIVAVLCCSIEFCHPWSNRASDIHFCLNSLTPEPPIAIVYRGTTNFNAKSLVQECLLSFVYNSVSLALQSEIRRIKRRSKKSL